MRDAALRRAVEQDVAGIDRILRQAGDVFGFVPRVVLARAINDGEMIVAEAHGAVVGAIRWHHRRDGATTIHEVVVAADWRGIGVGAALVAAVRASAAARGQATIRARCPSGAQANGWYRATGWEHAGTTPGRVRSLEEWRMLA